ncbi:Nif11-like leader peptide family natural product precursor [Synechococcus sp. CBW1002]|uniref:Nif11-like leader peptide family RiPP precursor n=1 Tax=Synechococcus sp. CBW1002 TaxID=1353134 RepID=UPI0018CF3E37|nr:Nif11-like leader peptide family RiPP precursor [Synechococcus sp. CBW1002]QPN61630.1 Nif11-like leader peptide family natural product precursor [Synechococcus sp. CBW1002]
MTEEQLPQSFLEFLEAVKGDSALQERLSAAADLDALVAIAKEAGYAISKAEITKAQGMASSAMSELSDEALAGVAGGAWQGPDNVSELQITSPAPGGVDFTRLVFIQRIGQ